MAPRALEVETQLQQVKRVTTELVLVEVLNYFAAYRQDIKKNIARAIRRWLESARVETVLHTHETFLNGLALYEAQFVTFARYVNARTGCAQRRRTARGVH